MLNDLLYIVASCMTILYILICIIMTAPIAKISQICLTKMLLTYNLTDVPVIRSQLFIPLILRNHVGILILKSMPPIILSHILTGIQTLCYSLFRIMANFKDLSLASAICLNCLQQENLSCTKFLNDEGVSHVNDIMSLLNIHSS